MSTPKKFYLTTPIYYVNARPHIGHAYTTIAADVIARRHRLLGDDTFFLTGTDEHGQKVERSAAAAGVSPQQFADQVSASFKALWDRMGITYDDYIRTTEPRHTGAVQKLFQDLCDRDAIYLSTYTGQYSVGEEMFVDGPPGTIGPDGKPTETVTEENYFFRLSNYQEKLIDRIESGELEIQPEVRRNEVLSFVTGAVVSTVCAGETLDVEEFDRRVKIGLEMGTLGQSAKGSLYVRGALKDLSISRTSFKWGIPVPGNEKHVIYVWLDALANYMTAIGYGSDDPVEKAKFERYWPADLHLVGKEIIRFHCVYWPAFLLAADLPLPKAITAHGWLLFEESKMSKSRGNIVRTETILDAFGTLKPKPVDLPGAILSDEYWKKEQDLFASDILRYFLLREIPFGQDGSFSFDALVQRYNSDLANGYGNLVSRTLTLIAKTSAGIVEDCLEANSLVFYMPKRLETHNHPGNDEVLGASEGQLLGWRITEIVESVGGKIQQNSFAEALTTIAAAIASVDQFLSTRKPWAATETYLSQQGRRSTLYTAAESIRIITALLYPFLPYATAKVWSQLGLGDIEAAARNGELKNLEWCGLKPGTKLGELGPIFPRAPKELIQVMTDMENPTTPTPSKLVDEKIAHAAPVPDDPTHPGAPPRTSALNEPNPGAQVAASAAISTERPGTPSHSEAPASGAFATSAAASSIPDTPQIAIDDFVKVDLRVAQIVVAERIPKADKLLRLEVDLGYEKRQILSGIAEWYTPEELIGRRIVVIANLAPRKMRGLESHGMLLAASAGENGKPVLATFGEEIALGSRLK
ncbi:MAG: methionine--tRNA ligase subunit beta [Edaphobacter sp.]